MTPDTYPLNACVVFRNLPDPDDGKWYMKPLKDGFKHVELWINDRGVWIRMDPCYEFPTFQAHLVEPEDFFPAEWKPTFVRVVKDLPLGVLPQLWACGPLTCVDAVKAGLGERLPFVKTPFQLYRYLTRGA